MKSREVDEEELEAIYAKALAHEKNGEFDRAARYYQRMLTLDVHDHAGAAIRLASMERGATPKTAPPAYIATLFDQHADVFDLILVDQLCYDVPQQLCDQLQACTGGRIFTRLLDLGCGTGLCAEALEDVVLHKTGVDLAGNMVAVAYEKGDYDRLWVGDIIRFLSEEENSGERWDLITATDVLPYMGDVQEFFTRVGMHLEDGGIFAFSSEKLVSVLFDDTPYRVGSFQRFAHQSAYLEKCLSRAGLVLDIRQDITVRQEQGEDVRGELFFSRRPGK